MRLNLHTLIEEDGRSVSAARGRGRGRGRRGELGLATNPMVVHKRGLVDKVVRRRLAVLVDSVVCSGHIIAG